MKICPNGSNLPTRLDAIPTYDKNLVRPSAPVPKKKKKKKKNKKQGTSELGKKHLGFEAYYLSQILW